MISNTIKQIVNDLNLYVNGKYNQGNPLKDHVVLKHIGKSLTNTESDEKIFVNLINIEEDSVYKNQMAANNVNGNSVQSGSYSMRVNMYVLFAFNPGESNEHYSESLNLLNDVLRYFQGMRDVEVNFPPHPAYTMDINYHNISLEDSNNLWSNMGGEQKPYAIYKFRLLVIEPDASSLITSSIITHPELTVDHK
jgi:hypothetical protein